MTENKSQNRAFINFQTYFDLGMLPLKFSQRVHKYPDWHYVNQWPVAIGITY